MGNEPKKKKSGFGDVMAIVGGVFVLFLVFAAVGWCIYDAHLDRVAKRFGADTQVLVDALRDRWDADAKIIESMHLDPWDNHLVFTVMPDGRREVRSRGRDGELFTRDDIFAIDPPRTNP